MNSPYLNDGHLEVASRGHFVSFSGLGLVYGLLTLLNRLCNNGNFEGKKWAIQLNRLHTFNLHANIAGAVINASPDQLNALRPQLFGFGIRFLIRFLQVFLNGGVDHLLQYKRNPSLPKLVAQWFVISHMVKPLQESCCPLVSGAVTIHCMLVSFTSLHVGVYVVHCTVQGFHLLGFAVWELNGLQVTVRTGDVGRCCNDVVPCLCGQGVPHLHVANEHKKIIWIN